MRNHSFENDFDLHENETACRTHFHMKGFALRLVLKQRHKRTRKWPISPCCSFVNSKLKTILSLKRGNKSNLQVNKRIPKFQPFWNKVFWPTKFLIVPLPIITRITMCNLHWCYTFCTGVTLFALVLHFLHWCYTFCAGITLFALVLHFLHWCYAFCTGVTLDCTSLNTHISILYYISTNTSCSAIYLTSFLITNCYK